METYNLNKALTIEKEQLNKIVFSDNDVLKDDLQKARRKMNLEKSEKLGNNYKSKVKIFFVTAKGELLAVETTVWSLNSDSISLKAGNVIPLKSIVDIEY